MKNITDGIAILAKYPNGYFAAEHDEIWAGPEDQEVVSDEDQKRLQELGWDKQDGMGWHRFV